MPQVTRKRLFNTIQDMKGKIRVFCRVRPMLDFEAERGQKVAISIPDELTAAHFWKDEKKQREYPFDQVHPSSLHPSTLYSGDPAVGRNHCLPAPDSQFSRSGPVGSTLGSTKPSGIHRRETLLGLC